uniref:Uncharacterized protein n=1 Tax=Anguilla anguilla TaxID=7936 RepID=A0A0E9V5D3_ANGAN
MLPAEALSNSSLPSCLKVRYLYQNSK